MKLVILAALVCLALAQDDSCRAQMKACKKEGFTDYSSDAIEEWGDVLKAKGMMELMGCARRYRCVGNWECMMGAVTEFKAGVEECADFGGDAKDLKNTKKFVWKMMKLVSDRPQLKLFSKAVCHQDDARGFGKCLRKAVEPAFLVYGPEFLHKQLRKKECIKASSQECQAAWAAKVEASCSCTAAMESRMEDVKAAVQDKCGADTIPDGVDVKRIHALMTAKMCSSRKDKLCMKAAKGCMKESMPKPMAIMMGKKDSTKAKMMLKVLKGALPAMGECMDASNGACIGDPVCAMEAVGKFKSRLDGCSGLSTRWAFLPKHLRMKKKMMKMAELVFGEDVGPAAVKAMCSSQDAATALRACLQKAFPGPAAAMIKAGLKWKSGAMATCAGQASDDCQNRWSSMWADKCSCAGSLEGAASDVAAFVAKKCGASAAPEGVVDFAALFGAKKAAVCIPAPGV